MFDLSLILRKNGVMSPVLCYSRKKIFEIIASHGASLTGLHHTEIIAGLNSREKIGTTYIQNGFAFPHMIIPDKATESALFLVLETPIAYGQMEDIKADIILALFLHQQTVDNHADEIEQTSLILSDITITKTIRSLRNIPNQIYLLIINACSNNQE